MPKVEYVTTIYLEIDSIIRLSLMEERKTSKDTFAFQKLRLIETKSKGETPVVVDILVQSANLFHHDSKSKIVHQNSNRKCSKTIYFFNLNYTVKFFLMPMKIGYETPFDSKKNPRSSNFTDGPYQFVHFTSYL